MSDSEEKRFEPTSSRLRRARHEGNVTRSGEVSSMAAFAAATLAATAAVPLAAAGAAAALRDAARGSFAAAVLVTIATLPLVAPLGAHPWLVFPW